MAKPVKRYRMKALEGRRLGEVAAKLRGAGLERSMYSLGSNDANPDQGRQGWVDFRIPKYKANYVKLITDSTLQHYETIPDSATIKEAWFEDVDPSTFDKLIPALVLGWANIVSMGGTGLFLEATSDAGLSARSVVNVGAGAAGYGGYTQAAGAVYDINKTGKVTLGNVAAIAGAGSTALQSPVSIGQGASMDFDFDYEAAFNPSGFQDSFSLSAFTDAQSVDFGFNSPISYSESLLSGVDQVSNAGAFDYSFLPTGYAFNDTSEGLSSTFGTQFLGNDAEKVYSEGNFLPLSNAGPNWSETAQQYLGVVSAAAKTAAQVASVYGAVVSGNSTKPPVTGAVKSGQSSTAMQNEVMQQNSFFGQLFPTGGQSSNGGAGMWFLIGGAALLAYAMIAK